MKSSSALLAMALAWVCGTAVQLQQAQLWSTSAYLALMGGALAVLGWCIRRHFARRWWWLPLALVAFSMTGWRAGQIAQGGLVPALEGQDVRVQGVVDAMPQASEAGVRFRLRVEQAQLGDLQVTLPQTLQLGWYSGVGVDFDAGRMLADVQWQPVDLRAGERWSMTVRLKAPHGQFNPLGFDTELWYWEQGIQALGYVRAASRDAPPERLGQTGRRPIESARQTVRDAIFAAVADRQQAGLIAALVVGDQNAIEHADWDVFRRTGVAHLVSISGLHITMFAWAAMAVVAALWRRSAWLCLRVSAGAAAWAGGVLLAWLYALFSGWGVPAQRTLWMLFLVGVLRWLGHRWPWPVAWSVVMAVVVALDPWALLQAGFWLSFVAVAVLFATDPGASVASRTRPGLGTRLYAAWREQLTITLALAPLSLLLFHQVSLAGLVANALAIPWVTLVLTPVSMLGVLWTPAWSWAALAAQGWMAVLQYLSDFAWASVALPAAPLGTALAALVGALWCVWVRPWRLRVLGLAWVWPLLVWQTARPAAGEFEMWAPDVGQGNAVLIRTAGHSLLFDTGARWARESDAGHRVLVPWLQALQEPVHTLVLSHRDSDHTGGAAAVLAWQPQAQVLGSLEAGHPALAGHAIGRCVAGQRWLWEGVSFEVLHPEADDYSRVHKSNAMSCVLRIGNGARTVLLTGDIEAAQEARLLRQGAALQADVLLVPHHGSKTSSSEAFIDAVGPKVAVVQSGYRNRFGHPAPGVRQRYTGRAIRLVTSPVCGAFLWRSAEPEQVHCERVAAQRYWHHLAAAEGESDS